jgi:hypothetical protein
MDDVLIPDWIDGVTKTMVLDESQSGVVTAVKVTYGNITVGTLLSGFHGSHELNPLRTYIRETLLVDSPYGSTIGWGLSLALATSIITKPEVVTPTGTVRNAFAPTSCTLSCTISSYSTQMEHVLAMTDSL